MRRHRTTSFRRPPTLCGICRLPLNYASGFFFRVDAYTTVHPDCQMYVLERGEVPAYSVIEHTCGNLMCVKPDHLELVLKGGQ